MANSEQSFADRRQRGVSMHAAMVTFNPPFAPSDEDLLPAAFDSFLDTLDDLNTEVAEAKEAWRDEVAIRSALVKDIKARALRALNRVNSNKSWASRVERVKTAVQNLLGYRTPKPKTPAEPVPGARRGARTDQSFGDIKALLDKVLAPLRRVPGYDTGAPVDITIAVLEGLSTQLKTASETVAAKEEELADKRSDRWKAYNSVEVVEDDDDLTPGLRERMKAIKAAVKSQYGSTGSEWAQIRGIRV